MSKPRIDSCEWDEMFPHKWSICGGFRGPNPWTVFPPLKRPDAGPEERVARFGSHEAAVRHLIKKGWRA